MVNPARFLGTDRSSRRLRTQLNGCPDEPDDSSTTLPAISNRPCRQRCSCEYAVTYDDLSVGG